jgi:hypothetical protein
VCRPAGGCCAPRSGPAPTTPGSVAAGRARVGLAQAPADHAARVPSGLSAKDRCRPSLPGGRWRRPPGRCRSPEPPRPREAAFGPGEDAHHGGRPVGKTALASVRGHKWTRRRMSRERQQESSETLHHVDASTHACDRSVVRNPPAWHSGHSGTRRRDFRAGWSAVALPRPTVRHSGWSAKKRPIHSGARGVRGEARMRLVFRPPREGRAQALRGARGTSASRRWVRVGATGSAAHAIRR